MGMSRRALDPLFANITWEDVNRRDERALAVGGR
jgi:hypothetical protein